MTQLNFFLHCSFVAEFTVFLVFPFSQLLYTGIVIYAPALILNEGERVHLCPAFHNGFIGFLFVVSVIIIGFNLSFTEKNTMFHKLIREYQYFTKTNYEI